jgi:hypothetical protein
VIRKLVVVMGWMLDVGCGELGDERVRGEVDGEEVSLEFKVRVGTSYDTKLPLIQYVFHVFPESAENFKNVDGSPTD